MSAIVTVYSNPGCQPCRATKKWLTDRGIPFRDVDLQTNTTDLEAVLALGYREAPVVIASVDGTPAAEVHWSGFNPIELSKLHMAIAVTEVRDVRESEATRKAGE